MNKVTISLEEYEELKEELNDYKMRCKQLNDSVERYNEALYDGETVLSIMKFKQDSLGKYSYKGTMYRSFVVNLDTINKDYEKLKSEVKCLRQKLKNRNLLQRILNK